MHIRSFLCWLLPLTVIAQSPNAPKPPLVNDPALRIELVATVPEVETCTTVCGDPRGAIYVGSDPRDGRLNTKEPVCNIVRFSSAGADRRRTIFADKLYSPAGSAWHDGWLYVIHDPFMTRFKDTDGDGVADVREDLIVNLGVMPQDTGLNDHCASGFTLGMDGCWYISLGDRGTFQTKSLKDGSTVSLEGGGILRCRTDGTQLEIFSSGTRNHLQVNLDAEDNAFTRDNTDDGNGWWTRLTHHIEGGYYGYPHDYRKAPNYGVTQPSQQTLDAIKQHGGTATVDRGLSTVNGTTTAAAAAAGLSTINSQPSTFLPAMADFGPGSPTGGLCYLSDGLPEKYRGKHLFSEWGKQGIFVTELARDGATFKLVSDTKLVEPEKGADFRPMQISVAADGSLLIADWGYGGWKSPKVAGAIWRLSWPEAKPAPRLADESKATVEELLAALDHPDRDQRLRAQAAFIANRGPGSETGLKKILNDPHAPKVQQMHALWALRAVGGVGQVAAASSTMINKDPAMRVQAMRALSRGSGKFLADAEPWVRLQAVISLGRMASEPGTAADRTETLIAMLPEEADAWVRFALIVAIRRQNDWTSAERWLTNYGPAKASGVWQAIDSIDNEAALQALAKLSGQDKDLARRAMAVAALGRVAYQPKPYDGHWWGTQPVKSPPPPKSVAWAGTPQALAALTVALGDSDSGVRLAAAKAFTDFSLDDTGKHAGAALRGRLTAEGDAAVRRQLIEALGVQKDAQAVAVFRQIALDEKADADFRETAIAAVVNIGGADAKKTIAQLANAPLSPGATRKIIIAAGELKVLEAAPALIAHLKDENPGNREFSARALQQLGPKSSASAALIEALTDKDNKVQVAAIDALGSYREKAALPALIAFAEKKKFTKETFNALANMPDESAIPVFVETLRDKNTSVRRNAIKALKAMREKAWPQVETLLASGRVPEELVPEIRNAFDSGAITKWKMVGVFENVWEAVHPPEKDALAQGGVANLAAKYHNAEGKDAGWINVTADADAGRVDLEKVFKSSAMVCAYAFTEIDAPEAAEAKLFTSADDELAVWINGARILNSSGSHSYEPDKNETPLPLRAGKNQLFFKIGNKGGPWIFHARIPGFENGRFIKSKEPTPEEKQRIFALATKPDGTFANAGDAKRGEKLFFDPNAALGGICATCHAVGAKGGQIGPALTTVGANYKRADLITSIHEPSKTIALGFEQVMLETKAGETVAGSLRSEAGEAFTIVDAAGKPRAVKKSDVKNRTNLHMSLMPPALTLGLKPADFTDLLAYLESLR